MYTLLYGKVNCNKGKKIIIIKKYIYTLTNCFHDACRFLGKEDWLTIQMEVVGERLSSLFVRAVLGFLAVKDQ